MRQKNQGYIKLKNNLCGQRAYNFSKACAPSLHNFNQLREERFSNCIIMHP